MASLTLERPRAQIETESNQEADVAQKVLVELGTPTNLLRVTSKHLWDDHYRVNIYCATESEDRDRTLPDVDISDSFFVTQTEGGEMICRPPIEKKY